MLGQISFEKLVGAVFRTARYAIRRPFLLSPRSWILAAAALVAVSAVVALVLPDETVAQIPLFAVPLIAALGAAAVFVAWRRLQRPSDKTVVYVARFKHQSAEEKAIARDHQRELYRRLAANELLQESLELRLLDVPIEERDASRILRHTSARAVVGGRGLAVGSKARWEAWIAFSWAESLSSLDLLSDSLAFGQSATPWTKHIATEAVQGIDAEYSLERLTAARFEADHADGVEGTLVLLGQHSNPERSAQACAAAARVREHLPQNARAMLAFSQGRLRSEAEDPLGAALELERVALQDANHPFIWALCMISVAKAGIAGEDVELSTVDRIVTEAFDAWPEEESTHFAAGYAYLGAGVAPIERWARKYREVPDPDALGPEVQAEGAAAVLAIQESCEKAIPYLQHSWEREPSRVGRLGSGMSLMRAYVMLDRPEAAEPIRADLMRLGSPDWMWDEMGVHQGRAMRGLLRVSRWLMGKDASLLGFLGRLLLLASAPAMLIALLMILGLVRFR